MVQPPDQFRGTSRHLGGQYEVCVPDRLGNKTSPRLYNSQKNAAHVAAAQNELAAHRRSPMN